MAAGGPEGGEAKEEEDETEEVELSYKNLIRFIA